MNFSVFSTALVFGTFLSVILSELLFLECSIFLSSADLLLLLTVDWTPLFDFKETVLDAVLFFFS